MNQIMNVATSKLSSPCKTTHEKKISESDHCARPTREKLSLAPIVGGAYNLKASATGATGTANLLDFPPNFMLITRNPFSFHCV